MHAGVHGWQAWADQMHKYLYCFYYFLIPYHNIFEIILQKTSTIHEIYFLSISRTYYSDNFAYHIPSQFEFMFYKQFQVSPN